MKYGLLIIMVVLAACTSDIFNTNQVALEGKWVDIDTRTDTLTFGSFDHKESLILGRGKEMSNGYLLPKSGSGSYDYSVQSADKISLRWLLSSNSSFTDYYFRQSGNILVIEKFFDTRTSGTMLTFRKID